MCVVLFLDNIGRGGGEAVTREQVFTLRADDSMRLRVISALKSFGLETKVNRFSFSAQSFIQISTLLCLPSILPP